MVKELKSRVEQLESTNFYLAQFVELLEKKEMKTNPANKKECKNLNQISQIQIVRSY